MHAIIVDTSSIIFAASVGVDPFEKLLENESAQLVVSQGIVSELRRISQKKTKEGRASRLALQMMEKRPIEVVSDKGNADRWILSYAKKGDEVCTNDIALKERLRIKGIKVITISKDGSVK